MGADLFISYAWTSKAHRDWVRLLASQLHLIGYDVKIDEDVDYGSSLHGFMRQVTEARHVLLIVDKNYVDRANDAPESGVGIETKWMSEVFATKPSSWLSVLYVENPENILPRWFGDHNPRGFDFNSSPEKKQFPGSFQLEEIWRWVEGLPASKRNAVPISVLRERSARLEKIDALRDPGLYVNPSLSGQVTFNYTDHTHFTVGYGTYEFKIKFSGHDVNSIYVYTDGGLRAVGLITNPDFDPKVVSSFLTPGRTITPVVGQKAILLNAHGVMCIIKIDKVQREVNKEDYVPAYVVFTYEILIDEETS